MICVTESVGVAVGLTPDGKVRGARVVELTEETYPWVKPLLDQELPWRSSTHGSIGSLIQRPASLFEVGGPG